MRITVYRQKDKSNQSETVSEVFIDDEFFCYGIEQGWNNNEPYKSCITDGVYNFKKFNSPRYGRTYAFFNPHLGVTEFKDSSTTYLGYNRYACLVHSANWARQLQGCLALGRTLSKQPTEYMITHSKDTVNEFLSILNKENGDIMVEVIWK